MKERKSVKKIFNKRGLTYVELLVALALLALIVVCFTPMLLTSYESLYRAGEKTQDLYNSQQQIEEGLAVRSSTTTTDLAINFKKNAETVFENINVTGRKIVSSLQQGLETIFYGVRARIDIISNDVVYDDTSSHEVILQTTGLSYNQVKKYTDYNGKLEDLPDNVILIDAFIPVKNLDSGTTTDEVVYNTKRASITDITYNAVKGRISFVVGGADFTQSPIKIVVYYKNERGYTKSLVTYLYIEPPTIILGGTTHYYDYYTSAGVEAVDASVDEDTKITKYVLAIEGRTMRLENSGYLTAVDSPKNSGAQINTITWVNRDENRMIKPYYVMAGTHGSVYRMYRYDSLDLTPQNVLGATNDITNTKDCPYDLSDGRRVYQDFWSGEMADQYYFRTEADGMGYGATSDNKKDCSRETQYNALDKNLKYLMIFSGGRNGYYYRMQASRRISYVLTEAGNKSFRLAGKKGEKSEFAGYTGRWEPQKGESGATEDHYLFFNRDVLDKNTEDARPIYLYTGVGTSMHHYERHLAYLSAFAYTSIDPYSLPSGSTIYNQFFATGDNGGGYFYSGYNDANYSGKGSTITNYLQTAYANTVNVTSAVYLEGAGSNGQGQVVYFGAVPAYTLIRQSSDITEKQTKVYNNDKIVPSRATGYFVYSDPGDPSYQTTNIYRTAHSQYNDVYDTHVIFKNLANGIQYSNTTDANASRTFYTRGHDNMVYCLIDNNLAFTFGYCSRWRMTVGDVTYNGSVEEAKSYEKYYKASHTAAGYDRVPSGGLNKGNENNLYYNVWFPGEHYTLTQTATCDEVTVACGYVVSGSTFMEESAFASGYYGTALGSIYNDGVIAAYTSSGNSYSLDASKGGRTTIFQNVLYYKHPDFSDDTLHSRPSVRFEQISLNAETKKTSNSTGTKNYYAYFSDNYGRVFRALVATANVSTTGSGDDSAATETVTIRRVMDTELQQIVVNGQSVDKYFSKVVSIEAKENIVIITGQPAAGQYNTILIATNDGNGNWTWKAITFLREFGALNITSADTIGSHYYIGVETQGLGYLAAIKMETLRAAGNGSVLWAGTYDGATNTCSSTDPDHVLYVQTTDKIYAMGGQEAD